MSKSSRPYRLIVISLICATFSIGSARLNAEALSLERVLASSLAHFPRIQSAVQEKLIQEGRVVEALGAFDLALEQDALVWGDGFYSGRSLDNKLVKPLPYANAKAFGGYRATNDSFPIYQQELVTNDGGEFNFGVVFSLWRDREIDKQRFALTDARIGVRRAEVDLQLARLATQRSAARAYWNYLAAARIREIYRNLTALAGMRVDVLEQRAAAGDVADIVVVENRLNLLQRQSAERQAERDLETAAIDLSLYLRDDHGEAIIASAESLPEKFPDSTFRVTDATVVIENVLERRPELAGLDNALDLERQRMRLARNELAPRIDVGLKASHDIGNGSRTREGLEAVIDLEISIPLERNRGTGQLAQARARVRQLELDRGLMKTRIGNEIRKLSATLNAAYDFVVFTDNEAVQAQLLEQAERKRFEAGDSDLFLVNLREQRSADALARNLESRRSYFNSLADLHALTLDFSALGL